MTTKGYFVSAAEDGMGFAVIAESEVEAKAAVHEAGWFEDDNDLGCYIIFDANIDGLPVGMVKDERDALCRGLYDYLWQQECDECKQDGDLGCYKGRALCEKCVFDIEHGDDEE